METARVSSSNKINFKINGVPYSVTDNSVSVDITLLVFIREYAKLRGTKAMCREGDCGACVISIIFKNKRIAVNSCLVPILICDGWNIETIEGIGNKRDGYHKIQVALAQKNGSQCGYCSPGMVMNMYSLSTDNSSLSMQQIENSFGGNFCRCTGYRAILDAFKGFATDAPPSMVKDIEDLCKIEVCRKYEMSCVRSCYDKQLCEKNTMLSIKLQDTHFYKVLTINEIFTIFEKNPDATYILNGGNTAHGIYHSSKKDIRIDINDVPDLHKISKSDFGLVLGGSVTLTTVLETFQKYSNDTGFKYLTQLAQHIEIIANIAVRNIGTIAGNLMMKYQHNEFSSDLFLILESVGAHVNVQESPSESHNFFLYEFLNIKMDHKIINSILLYPLRDNEYVCRFYKIMPRAQNARGHVDAGFFFKLDGDGKVLELPNIIFGGINKHFKHAEHTEKMLVGKSIFDKKWLEPSLAMLHAELQPDHVLPDYSPEFRRTLAEGLFYKFLLSINIPENVDPIYRSGGTLLERGLSSGAYSEVSRMFLLDIINTYNKSLRMEIVYKLSVEENSNPEWICLQLTSLEGQQEYDTNKGMWPVNKPMPKLESFEQTSGEAQYCNDLGPYPREVFCTFVLTEIGNGKIDSIDASNALKIKGVVTFLSAKDIPGKNLCISAASKLMFLPEDELLFAEQDILYAGQPIGVIVAETQDLAIDAAKLVEIKYSEPLKTKPVISIEDALNSQDNTRVRQSADIPAKRKGTDIKHVIKGGFQCGGQYHHTLETQSCVCVPVEGGIIDVYPSSQWMDLIQISIANCLNVRNNSINVHVSRLGGSYGSKISRNVQISCTCALVCYKLRRPARFIMTTESNMQSIGKRCSVRQEYEIGVNNDGVIQYLNSNHWSNCGSSFNESQAAMIASYMQRCCYLTDTWTLKGFDVRTDLPSNTFCRGSGTIEGVAMIENIMEHIAKVTDKDPTEVRLANMNDEDKLVLETTIKDLSNQTDYQRYKESIDNFNLENRWKKKGIATVPTKYLITYEGQFDAMVSICARDGSVCVTHSGIEIDQGINTKIAQVTAFTLGIDMEIISVKQSNNIIASNESTTGHSITTISCGYATIEACNRILTRLQPIREEMKNPKWKDIIFSAYQKGVDLCEHYVLMFENTKSSIVYGATTAEVEIDLLTGQHIIRKVDLIINAGLSINPEIDIGQIEGAFVMGIGYWTSEDLVYDPDTGVLTNNRSWNYKSPGAKDIPEDFRICLRALNSGGIYNSKPNDESPFSMSYVIPIAIRKALNSARADAGNTEWYQLELQFGEKIQRSHLGQDSYYGGYF